jgi:hypothetical protein
MIKATRTLLFFGMAAVASATSVTFNFNSLAENASATTIASYMTSVLTSAGCTGCSVTVTGAVADTTYDGENHVTGPGTPATGFISKSLTLGTSDGATASNTNSTVNSSYDTFLATTNDASTNISSQITMKFSGFTINGSASFDYEIFPDGTCTALPCGSNTPDFKFEAGTNSNGTDPFVTSFGTNGTQLGVTPGTTDGNTNNSQLSNSEATPQYIGTWSGSLSNVNELDFVDWPATIGVDNLAVTWTTTTQQSPVPEPFSVVLLGTIIGGIALRKKIRKAVA